MSLADGDGTAAPSVEVVRGTASEEELAALIAVVSQAYVREAASATAPEVSSSAWTRTQRGLRRPLRRDIPWGAWVNRG